MSILCAICAAANAVPKVVLLPCGHSFDKDCIVQWEKAMRTVDPEDTLTWNWASRKLSCPTCRREYRRKTDLFVEVPKRAKTIINPNGRDNVEFIREWVDKYVEKGGPDAMIPSHLLNGFLSRYVTVHKIQLKRNTAMRNSLGVYLKKKFQIHGAFNDGSKGAKTAYHGIQLNNAGHAEYTKLFGKPLYECPCCQ
jgi:hypothetical protein